MKRELWLRLRNYHFENLAPPHLWDHVAAAFGNTDASTRAFANKIARKHGWHPRFARRAIDEYRKFVFLGVTADFIVTPPKIIDQVWHEHLLFSKAYREFCRDVLQRDFDHNPELIPSDEHRTVRSAIRRDAGVVRTGIQSCASGRLLGHPEVRPRSESKAATEEERAGPRTRQRRW